MGHVRNLLSSARRIDSFHVAARLPEVEGGHVITRQFRSRDMSKVRKFVEDTLGFADFELVEKERLNRFSRFKDRLTKLEKRRQMMFLSEFNYTGREIKGRQYPHTNNSQRHVVRGNHRGDTEADRCDAESDAGATGGVE
ncbi:hypothetical protein DPMN_126509 [Dreissena polymorpha]|uniref:Uncharacterized protein n=1 Tax=Dreissena polymorpha TaxID=45954 RepID=A0A9D4GZI3_DREPO|nr:hypothetical protein DPMN_126509 [Dreissena polymorpha]